MAEIRFVSDPMMDELGQVAEQLAHQSKAENRDLTADELKTLPAAIDKFDGKLQGKVEQEEEPAVLSEAEANELVSTIELDFQNLAKKRQAPKLRHSNIDTKTKNQARDFTPDEINHMTEYFRRANKEIYQQKKINVSGAEADRLLRKVQFTENNPEQTSTGREM